MVEGISHITFVVKNLQKTAELLETVFDAKKVYDSGDKTFSISKELFYLIGDQWIVIMENEETVNRTYHHVAFKIKAQDLSDFERKIKKLNLEMKPSRSRISGEGQSLYFYDYDNNLFELHTGTLEERLKAYQNKISEL